MVLNSNIKKMTYEQFGNLIFSGKLKVINFNYDEKYTIVINKNNIKYKVEYSIKENKAIFTRIID
jgi:hypothetical protein